MASGEKKRHRQSEVRRARNHAAKSRVKTLMKKVGAAVESGESAAVESSLRTAVSALHRAGQKRLMPKHATDRHIGQLSKLVHKHKIAASVPS